MRTTLPGGIGLWSGFLDRLPAADATAAAREIEREGIGTIWLQESSGVDPFARAALYLQARMVELAGAATAGLHSYLFTESDLETTSDALVEALAVPDVPAAVGARIDAHRSAGADHVQVQLVPPPHAAAVLAREWPIGGATD